MFDSSIIPQEKEEAIKKDIAQISTEAVGIAVSDDESMAMASEFLTKIKGRLNRLKDLRTELTKPIKDAVKKTDNWFKMQESPLKMMEQQVKMVIVGYINKKEAEAREVARVQAEKEAKERKAIEDEAKKNKVAPPPPPAPIAPIEKVKASVRTEGGLVSTSKVWTWEVEDLSKVPRKYLEISRAAVTAEVRNGKRAIKGINIYQKTNVSVR